jgi:hypothetical protein
MPLRWARCGGCGLAAAAGVVAWVVGGAIAAVAPATTTAERAPGAAGAAATPATDKSIAQQIVPTAQEKAVLDGVVDRTERFDKDGLFAALCLAARAPQLELRQWYDLDRPAYANLLASPRRYRATPLVMPVRVVMVTKLQQWAGLELPPGWPAERPVWDMDCVEADTRSQRDKPLRVYSLVDPAPFIGQPEKVGERGRREYPAAPQVRVAAVFYRIRHDEDAPANVRDRPELVAWQISRALSPGGDEGGISTSLSKSTWVIVLAVGTIVLYYITKRRLAKARRADELPVARRRMIGTGQDEKDEKGAKDDEKEGENGTYRPG